MKTFVAKIGENAIEADTLQELAASVLQGEGNSRVWVHGILSAINRKDLGLAFAQPVAIAPTIIEQTFLYRGRPKPAKKTTANGVWAEEQRKYHEYKDGILQACVEQGFKPIADIFAIDCDFFFPLPKRCFSGGRYNAAGLALVGQPKRSKPDADNLTKPIADALCPARDERVWAMSGRKFYGADAIGCIVIRLKSYG